jgi:hypothetical protein
MLVNTIYDMTDQLAIFAAEVKKVAREVGTEGKLERARYLAGNNTTHESRSVPSVMPRLSSC